MILKAKWFGQNVSVLVLHRTLPPGWCKQVIQSSLQYHRGFDRLNHRSIFTSSFDVRYSMFDIFIHEPAASRLVEVHSLNHPISSWFRQAQPPLNLHFIIRCSIFDVRYFYPRTRPAYRPGRLRQAGDTNKHELYQSLRSCFKHSVTLCRHCVTLCNTVVKNHPFIQYHRGFDRLNHHFQLFNPQIFIGAIIQTLSPLNVPNNTHAKVEKE